MSEVALGNIFFRPLRLNKGEKNTGHTHAFDHATFVNRGSLRIEKRKDHRTEIIEVSAHDEHPYALIEAGAYHELTALEDDSIYYCIYAHRDPQGQVVQRYTGWLEAYL